MCMTMCVVCAWWVLYFCECVCVYLSACVFWVDMCRCRCWCVFGGVASVCLALCLVLCVYCSRICIWFLVYFPTPYVFCDTSIFVWRHTLALLLLLFIHFFFFLCCCFCRFFRFFFFFRTATKRTSGKRALSSLAGKSRYYYIMNAIPHIRVRLKWKEACVCVGWYHTCARAVVRWCSTRASHTHIYLDINTGYHESRMFFHNLSGWRWDFGVLGVYTYAHVCIYGVPNLVFPGFGRIFALQKYNNHSTWFVVWCAVSFQLTCLHNIPHTDRMIWSSVYVVRFDLRVCVYIYIYHRLLECFISFSWVSVFLPVQVCIIHMHYMPGLLLHLVCPGFLITCSYPCM